MGKRSDIERRLHTLTDINAILRVMRTLAIMEMAKLSRFLSAQRRVVASIEDAAADFLHFYPEVVPTAENSVTVRLMIGSERGFCGDFNETVLRAGIKLQPDRPSTDQIIVAVGSRICSKIRAKTISLAGASTVEEVQTVISRVIEALNNVTAPGGDNSLRLTVLCHDEGDGDMRPRTLHPFPLDLAPRSHRSFPPILNLPPVTFYSELAGHYLFAALHEMFYQSLMAENQQRQRHIDNAARRIDEKIGELNLKKNMVRQEEIIEEIETLLLSAEPEFHHGNDLNRAHEHLPGAVRM